jgi:class 3 adenylate cyclase
MSTQHGFGKRGVVLGAPRLRPQVAVLSWRVAKRSTGDERANHALEATCDRLAQVVESHELPYVASDSLSGFAAAGLSSPSDPVLRVVLCALGMLEVSRREVVRWPLQVGIHYGTVCAGTERSPTFPFHLSGDVVVTAGAVRDVARVNTVTLTSVAWRHISNDLHGRHRGHIDAPGGTVEILECTGAVETIAQGES